MYVVAFFVSNAQATPIEQPVETSFDDVTVFSKTTAMFSITLSDNRIDLATTIVDGFDRRNCVDDRDGHLRVVKIGRRMFDGQGRPFDNLPIYVPG